MYFNFENYESKGGSKEHFLNSFTKNYDLENDTYERVQKGIESFNKENNTSFDLYDYLKFNSKKIKFKKKEPLQEQGKEDLNEDLAEQKEPLQDENLEENKSFKRKHDLSKESEILNDTSLLSDVKNSLKRGAETLSDVVGLDELVNFDSDIKSKADENIKDLIKQGASYEDLNELEKNYLANKESRENVRDATNIFSKEKSIKGLATLYGTNEEEKAKKAFAEMKSTQEALSKEKFEDLNEQEKGLIDKERGAVESFFVNLRDDEYKQKSFDELKEKYEAKNFISKDVLRDLEFLKNIHQSKSVSSLILSADEKEKKDYENSVLNIALNAGFDDVLVDEKEGKMYFEKEGQKYLVNEGFFDNFTNTLLANTGSITGGLIGAAKGASSAKSPQSALAKSIAYSALGSGIGASADVLATNYLLDRKNRFDEMLHHALEESALSAVGDALVLGAKPLLKTAKDSIKDFGKILDYTPLVSTTKNFPTQNIKAAQDLVEKSVDLNTQKELDEFYKAYGGRSDLADSKALDALVDTFKAKFGEDSFISKNTQKLNDILNLNSLSAKQNALFEAIRADESGFLLPYVKEVASYDVRAFKNLKNILNLSTQRLENSLKNMNLNKGDIKGILDELEKGTKEDYNEVMNEILAKTYDDRFKVVLSRSVTPEATPSLNLDSVMTKAPSNYSTLKQNLQEDYDLLDKTKPLRMAKKEELNDKLLQRAMKSNAKIWLDNVRDDLASELGLKNAKITMRGSSAEHILKRHGKNSNLVQKSGQEAVTHDEILTHNYIVNNADKQGISTAKDGQKVLISGKQINGHYIVVESISTKNNELNLKSLYKEKGDLANSKAFDEVERLLSIENNQAVRSLSPKPSANLDNSHLSTLNNYTTFRKNLQEQGLLDEEALKFLNYVESTIYNPKGVTFTQLNNALKNINSFYKQSTNPGFKEHIKNAVQSFLRDDIKKGINEIFKQDKNLYAKASKLYETSLAEYAQMKELLKASAYKKARNESTTQVKALDELIKYSKGQGKDGLNNLDFLRAKLDEKDVAILEMNLLNRLYEKSLANTDESLRVFDSTSFLNELSSLQNNAFKSKEANEFIELVKGFDKLFKNDAKIALELAPVTAKKEGSALATSAKGAVLQKIVKSGFDLVFRNLGQNVLFGAFKDSIQGAALRYHLKKALQKSDTISEFNTSFKDRLKKGQFNSKTKELSKEFLNEVDKFSKSLDEEVLRDTKASDEGLKDLPKENINKEVAEATPSDTTSQKIIQKIKNEVNVKDLSQSQKDIYDVIVGNKDKAILQGKDLNDIYTLEKGSRKAGLHKILVKHAGLKKTGGLSTDELLDMQRIIKDGDLDENSFTQYNNFIRYAYELKEKDTTLRLVVDEYNDGKKVFDYYSDRNFIDYKGVYSPLVEGSHSTQPVLSKDAEPTTAGDISLSKDKTNSSTNLAKEQEQVEILQAKKQEVLNKIKSKEHKEYLRLQTKLEESKQLEAQAFKELEPIKQRIISQTKAKEFYAQALEKLDISAFNAYQIKDELKPIFSTIKKARRGQEHYKERLFSYPLKKLQGKSLTFNEKEFPLYENALTLKQSHSIDKNPKLIQERVALRKAIESHLDIKPIKEFGKNYAEGYHDGAFSIQKLLTEAKDYEARKEAGNLTKAEMEQGVYKGQVAGAFYKEGLGDIDLVWGDSTFGLAHILERRTQDFIKEGLSEAEARAKAMNFINSIPEIIEKGELSFGKNRAFIDFDNKRGLIALDYKGDGSKKWLITAYKEYDAPTSAKPHQSEHNIDTSSVNRIDGDKTNSTTNTAKRQEEVKEAVGNTVTQTQEQINSNLNKSLQEAQKIFKAYNKDKYNDKLFDKVIEVANSLGVRYWEQSNPKWVNGTYTYYLNRAMIDTKLFMFDQKEIAPTLLHELIHSTTSRALHLYDNGHKELLSKAQQEAIAELKDIYTLITSKNKDKQWISYADTKTEAFKNQNRIYGLKNEHEMLAELSNKDFRDFLKEQNIFVKIINAIKKFFGIEEKQADSISTNAFKELEQSLYKIIDNYENPQHFTSEFDRIYNIENFVDFDNYRKYIKDNYERFKEFKKPRDYYTHSDTPYAILVDDMFQKYNLDGVFEFRDTPLGEKLFEISKDKDKLGNILAIIEPFFKNNLQSTLSKEYVDNLLKNINEIKNKKNLIYNKKPVNDFFVSEYVLKEVEKLQHAQNAFSTIDKALLSKAQSKFKFDEKKASDLLEWHKDSSPITKDKDGLPKVFYHGSKVKGLEEFKSEFDESGLGFWFNANENRAKAFARSSSDKLYPVFLYIKKPFDLNQSINTKNVKELSELLGEDLHKYVATNKERLQKELDKATNSKDFAVIEGRGLMLEGNKKPSEYAYAYNGKWYVNLYNETDLQREGLQKLLPFMQKAQNLNQTKTITELLNEKEMGEYQENTHRFLQNLKAKGYDSILPNGKASDDDIIVFDSSQIKHINNKGSYTDESGNIRGTKPKDTEAKHRYFNEKSPNIYYSNQHIGTGLASGTLAGLETDENGNIVGFDPQKFALGFLGGSAGSIAVSKGFKLLKEKPEFKEAIKKELADTLAKGWENASKKYPLLDLIVKPQYIMQNEKARVAQAGHLIKKIEKQNLEHTKQDIIKDLDNLIAENIPQELSKEEFLTKGLNEVINKENFVKHLSNSQNSFMRLKYLNLVEPTKQRANIEFTQGERKGYIKAFKDKNKNLFYVLITEDKDKLLITGIPTSKKREVIRQIKKADFITRRMGSIDTLSPTAKATAKTENVSTSQSNSTIDKALLSKKRINNELI